MGPSASAGRQQAMFQHNHTTAFANPGDQCIHPGLDSEPALPDTRMGRSSAPRTVPARPGVRLAADIGGTFTDVAVFDDRSGKLVFGKALSTPSRLVDGISTGVAKAGGGSRPRPVPARLDGRDQHRARAYRRPRRAHHHGGVPRHLRDRPHQPAGRLQPVFQETRAAGCARAAVRGQGTGSGRRRDRPAARRARDRSLGSGCSNWGSRPAPSCSSIATPSPIMRRAPRRSWSRAIPTCSSRPRMSSARNTASSSAARPWWRTPISGPRCAAISARSTIISGAPDSAARS